MTTEIINVQVREDGSRVVERRIAGIGDAAARAADPVDRLKGLLATLVTGAAVAQVARLADEYTNMQNKLRIVTTSTENLVRVQKELTTIANGTRSDLAGTVQIYTRLASSQDELGVSQQQLLGFTKSLNQAIILSGASATEAQAGLIQLSQGMASGTLRGDELRSVLEQLPAVADVIAKGLGVTRGQLRALGQEGKITAKDIIDAFAEASDELEGKFGQTVPTMGQALTVLKNQILTFVGELDQTYGISTRVAQAILWIGDNLKTIVPILVSVGAAIAVIFAIDPILKFMGAIKSLWALMLANPFVVVAAAIAGVLSYLYLMRDEIKLGIDETTTLGDLMRAVWEQVGPIIRATADIIAQFFGWLTNTSAGTFNQLLDHAVGYGHESESTWLKLLRVVVQVFDMIGGTIRGVMAGVQAVVLKVIAALMNNFEQLGNAFTAATNFDGEGLLKAVKSNIEGYKAAGTDIGGTFGAAFAKEQLSQSQSGLEAMLDDTIKRAQEISKARNATTNVVGGLNPASGPGATPKGDDDAAKKAAKELERLKDALANVLDDADPVGAALRRLAEAEDILTRSVAAGLITQTKANAVYDELEYKLRDQLDPLAAVNRSIDENTSLLKLNLDQRQIEGDLLAFTKQLRQDGIKLTEEETAALRAKLIVEQELSRISAARDQIESQSTAQRSKDLNASIAAIQELTADSSSGFGLVDSFNAANDALGGLLTNTTAGIEAQLEATRLMYDEIDLMREKGIIDEQTASEAKVAIWTQQAQTYLNLTADALGTVAALMQSNNKTAFRIGKAAAIAQATITSISTAMEVYKSAAAIPYVGWILGPVAAAAALATGAMNVSKIRSQQMPGYRTGGEYTVGGYGGVDSQTVAFRASPGEKISINTPAQARAIENMGERREGDRIFNSSIQIVQAGRPNNKTGYQQARFVRDQQQREFEDA